MPSQHYASFAYAVVGALPLLYVFHICRSGCPPDTVRLSHLPWWVPSQYCASFPSAVADALLVLYVFNIYRIGCPPSAVHLRICRGGCPPGTVRLSHLPWRMPSCYWVLALSCLCF
jgi:hypothetical protein